MLAGLGSFLVLAPACGQSGQMHGAADAAPTNGDVGTADVPIYTGNDAGPDAAVTATGTATGTGTGTGDAGHSDGPDGGRSSDANTSVDGSTDAGIRTDSVGIRTDAAGGTTDAAGARTDVAGVTPDASHIPPPNTFNMGMNVPSLNYYNNVAIYADMALAISGNDGPWDNANGAGAAPLDVNGNPTVAASSSVTAGYPSGDYAFSWDGTGSIKVTGASLGKVTVTTNNGVQHNAATMTFVQQRSTATTSVWITFNATPPITNFHVMAPSAAVRPGSMFVNDFLTRMQPFSTLRFMDALNTNDNNTLKNWSQRSWPNGGSRANTVQGMAYEDIIALANETGVEVWINVPALASDDYVCRLARLFRYGEQGDTSNTVCDPSAPAGTATTSPINNTSKIYVEYSNEIWNWGFHQVLDTYCMVFGVPDQTTDGKVCSVTAPVSAIAAAALANSALPWNNSDKYSKASQFIMILEKRQSDIFRTVFGCASGAHCQAQIPMNVQAAYAAEVDEGFQFLKKAFGSTGAIDLMAVAPYFDIDDDSNASTVDGIFSDLQGSILAANPPSSNGNAIANWLKADLAEAALYNLPLVAYEGGQGLSGSTNQANKIAAQSDPRMYDATRQYFALWDTLVGKKQLFTYFTYAAGDGSWGAWGALVGQADPGAQKWDALLSLTRTGGDANLDGIVDAADCAILRANFGNTGMWWMQGDFNHDGTVDGTDLATLNANITGPQCAAP
jgi:hypothetical protein